MSNQTPVGSIQFDHFASDPSTPVGSSPRRVTPPAVSSKVARSGLVHVIGNNLPQIPHFFGEVAHVVPDEDSQE